MTEIEMAAPAQAEDEAFVAEVTGLVNTVYADGEKGIWVAGTARTDRDELASIIRAGELAVARRAGKVLGAVRIRRLPSGEGEFGMLAAHPGHRGTGLGRELVAFAEDRARDQGVRTMQLEVLFPNEWEHPTKVFLRDWYIRSGYQVVRKGDFSEDYPHLVPHLATACDYLIFTKAL
jgi:ribosomal protein S18 acetylase RimI-like enzyme